MTEKILKNYFVIFTDCWELFKKYSAVSGEDDYWDALSGDADLLYRKHGSHGFSSVIISEVLAELERLYREKNI